MVRPILVAFTILFFCSQGWAEDTLIENGQESGWNLQISRPAPRILDLELRTEIIPVDLEVKDEKQRAYVRVIGDYRRPGWKLLANGATVVNLTPKSKRQTTEFAFKAFFASETATIQFVETNGEQEIAETIILETKFPQRHQRLQSITDSDWHFFSALQRLNYEQTDFGKYESLNLAVILRYRRKQSLSRWTPSAQAEITTPRLISVPKEYSPLIAGAYMSLLYRLDEAPREYTKHIGGGLSYLTMIPNGSPFGLVDLVAPVIEYHQQIGLPSHKRLDLTARFSLLERNPLKVVEFQQRGLDLLGSFFAEQFGPRGTIFSVHWRNWAYKPDDFTKISLNSIAFSLGFRI